MRMKYLIVMVAICFTNLSTFAILQDSDREISMKGDLSFNTIKVIFNHNLVITTFAKDVRNVTITVKKKSGETIQTESLDAKTFDQVPVKIDNYEKGNYTIEIVTEEGKAEGRF